MRRTPSSRTLADKVNWLFETAHPAGRGPYSDAEVVALIEKVTGERFSHTTIWKLRNGQSENPQKRLIEAMARTFGVRPDFFFGGPRPEIPADLTEEEFEMLAMIRGTRITLAQLRPFLALSPEVRQLHIHLITALTRDETRRRGGQSEGT